MSLLTQVGAGDGAVAAPPAPKAASRQKADAPTLIVTAAVVAVLLIILVLPLVTLLSTAATAEGLEIVTSMVTSPVNRTILLNTMLLGLLVGAVGTLVGFILAYAQVKLAFRGKKLLHLVALMPIVAPPFAVATAAIVLFGRNGIINRQLLGMNNDIYGLPGLVFVLSLSFFPVAYMNFKGMLETLDPSLDESAASLGSSKLRVFWTVTVPMLVPGFAGSFLLLFVEAIADLANPLVLGGDFTVLSSRAYLSVIGEFNMQAGAAFSLVLLMPALLVFLVQRYWTSRKNVVSVSGKPAGRTQPVTAPTVRIPLLVLSFLILAVILLMYATVFAGAFTKILGVNNEFTLKNFAYVFSGVGLRATVTTLVLALIATPIAGILGMVIAWLVVRRLKRTSGLLDFVGMLGLAVPGTVIGIGYALAFNTPFEINGVKVLPALAGGGAIMAGAIAIVMVYVIRSLPSGQRSGIASMHQISPAIEEASISLGSSHPMTFVKITLPLIRPALISGLTYAFARSMTTLSPIVFITTPQVKIITSQILSEVGSGRFGNAFAFCVVLIVIVLTVIGGINLVTNRLGARDARSL